MTTDNVPQLDETLIHAAPLADLVRVNACAPRLVEGSAPRLADETISLLGRRLQSASLLLAVGFFAFLVRRIASIDELHSPIHRIVFVCHVSVTLITLAIGGWLLMEKGFSNQRLRWLEVFVFGSSGMFFYATSYSALIDGAEHRYLANVAPMWMVLIFTYALFIPNTLRRAALGVGAMAFAGISSIVIAHFTTVGFNDLLSEASYLKQGVFDNAMVIILSALIATWGVHTINVLRKEAFEARQYGQYRLVKKLGAGGMGEVYLAEHNLLKRPSAIKLIRPDVRVNPKALQRFEAEVQATAALSHWNTVEIFDYGRTDDGTFYYVMEYLPGLDLQQIVERHGPMPPARVIFFLKQIAGALAEAHHSGIIHRDIKPANIIAAHRGGQFDVAKLVDFGLVPIHDENTPSEMIVGSPLYMSPEQFHSPTSVDYRSDLYSLGVTAYFLLTANYPFSGENAIQIMQAHANEQELPTRPSKHRPVPRDLEIVIMRCLERCPQNRIQSANELLSTLAECEAFNAWTEQLAADWWQKNP